MSLRGHPQPKLRNGHDADSTDHLGRDPGRWYLDLTAWTAALAISGYPVAGLFSTYLGIADDSISVPFRVFVFAMAIAAFWRGIARAPLRAVDGWLVAFWVVYSFRLLWDTYIEEVPDADVALLSFGVTVLVPVVALALVANTWNERNVILCFMVVGTIVCAGGIWLSQSGLVDIKYLEETGRLGFYKVNPISLGHVGCTTALASIALFDRTDSKLLKGIALACAGIALAMLYVAASRGPVVAFVASIIAYVLFRGRWKYAVLGFVGIGAAIAVFSIINMDALLEQLRFATVAMYMDASVAARSEYFEEAIEAFKQHPVFGSSFALPISGGWVHNIFLEAAMAVGVVGLAILVIVCARSFVWSVHAFRTGNTMSAFLFLQFGVAAQFSGALWGWPGLWIGVALTSACRRRGARNRRAS